MVWAVAARPQDGWARSWCFVNVACVLFYCHIMHLPFLQTAQCCSCIAPADTEELCKLLFCFTWKTFKGNFELCARYDWEFETNPLMSDWLFYKTILSSRTLQTSSCLPRRVFMYVYTNMCTWVTVPTIIITRGMNICILTCNCGCERSWLYVVTNVRPVQPGVANSLHTEDAS